MSLNQRISSFYITEFSDETKESDLWKALIKKGKVVDVYIAKKRNKVGKRFGFARFLDVKDIKYFLRSVRDIEVNGCRVIISIARFEKKSKPYAAGAFKFEEPRPNLKTSHRNVWNMEQRSFADVVGGKKPAKIIHLESSPIVLEWAM